MESNRLIENKISATSSDSPRIPAVAQKRDLDYRWVDRCIGSDNEAYEEDSESPENWSSSQSLSRTTEDLSPLLFPPLIKEDLVEEEKRPGRKKEPDSQLLSQFISKNGPPPKKEYLRCKLIRGHKKLNRQILTGSLSSKHICAFDEKNSNGWKLWNRLQKHFFANQKVLEAESKTESGPATDGKKKRGKKRQIDS